MQQSGQLLAARMIAIRWASWRGKTGVGEINVPIQRFLGDISACWKTPSSRQSVPPREKLSGKHFFRLDTTGVPMLEKIERWILGGLALEFPMFAVTIRIRYTLHLALKSLLNSS